MLNTDTIAHANAHAGEKRTHERLEHPLCMCIHSVYVCVTCDRAHTHANRVVTSLSCHSQQLSCVVCDNKRGW